MTRHLQKYSCAFIPTPVCTCCCRKEHDSKSILQSQNINLFSRQKLSASLIEVLKVTIEHGHLCLLAQHACVYGRPGFGGWSCPHIPSLQQGAATLYLEGHTAVMASEC